jgi:hypothetical protein
LDQVYLIQEFTQVVVEVEVFLELVVLAELEEQVVVEQELLVHLVKLNLV